MIPWDILFVILFYFGELESDLFQILLYNESWEFIVHIIILWAQRSPKGKKSVFFPKAFGHWSHHFSTEHILTLVFLKLSIGNTASTFKCLVLFSHMLFQVTFLLINSLTQEGIYISIYCLSQQLSWQSKLTILYLLNK